MSSFLQHWIYQHGGSWEGKLLKIQSFLSKHLVAQAEYQNMKICQDEGMQH